MKLIKAGKTFRPFEIQCGHCDAVMQVESVKDLKRVTGGDFLESWDYLTATCPHCGQVTRIETNDSNVPRHMLDDIPRGT